MAEYEDDAPPPGYRYVYFGDPTQGTSGRYPVPIETPIAEPNRDVLGTSAAPSLPTVTPELQPEPSRNIAPHRYVAGEVPGGPAPEPTLDQMRYELAIKNLTPADWLMGVGENAASLLTSPIGMLGGYAGLGYHMLRGAPFEEANRRAADWAQASMYQPTTMAGQEIAEKINPTLASLPPVISGIMPGLMRPPKGTTGALTAGVKRDVGQFSNDVFNAQRGITPGYPTMGSEFSDAFVTPRPTVYDMLAGLEPSRIPSTASPAVKTKGGNFPTSFDNDLEVSGQIGRHLSRKLSNIPLDENRIPNLAKRDPIVAEKWQNFIDSKDISYAQALYWKDHKEYHDRYKELVSEFINQYKDELPQLTTLTDTEKLLQAQNSFIQNQYARYLTNEMGTGAKTDTLVRLAEQGIAIPEIAEVFDANYPGRAADLEGPWVLPAVKNLLTANKLKGIEAVQQTATTPYGKYIESLADEGVTPTSKKLYEDLLTLKKQLGLPTKYADKPTPFERVPEDMPIWDLPELWSNSELGLDRILEKLHTDLKSGAIKPENVKNVSMESLVRGLMDENLKKLEAERKLLLENLKATPRFNVPEPTQLSFVKSPGMTWIDIPETTDAKGLKLCTTLGKQAGWCTQDALTAKTYGSGNSRLTTLVDAEGRPHAQAKISELPYPPKWEEAKPYLDAAKKQAETLPNGYTNADISNIAVQMAKDARPKNITELKPPENSFTSERSKTYSKRDPEYKAKITDSVLKFLNAGDWGNVKDLDLYDILDTRNSSDLNAYAKRAKLSGDKAVLNKFEAAELLGRTRPGRFATDKEITEFINGPETLLYNHGSPTGGMTELRTDIDRTRAAGTGLWLAQPYETAGTYAGMKGSIYNVEVKNKDLDVLDARNSEGGNIPLDAVIYHADGNKTTLKELADYLGVSTLSTDDVAKYSKSEGAKGLHILNVADISGRANPFVNTAPDYANNLVVFDPSIVKVIKEDKAPPFVPAVKVEKPLTEKQFYSRYSQHVDIRNRENQQGAETLKSIQESGWKPGFSVNTLPPYRGGMPTNVVDKKLAPRTGDYVYLVPNTFTTKTGNGLKINEGWTPKAHEAFQVTEDYPDMYKEYLKAFNAKAEGGIIHMADGGAVFNPQGADYDYQTARAHGMGQDGGNWGSVAPTSDDERMLHGLPEDSYLMLKGIEHPTWDKAVEAEEARGSKIVKHGDRYYSVPAFADGGKPRPLSYVENKPESFADYRRGIGMKEGTVSKFEGGAVTDTLDKMVKSPQASTLLNLDLPNLIAAKQQVRPMKRGGKVDFSNNIDDMRYALTRRQG